MHISMAYKLQGCVSSPFMVPGVVRIWLISASPRRFWQASRSRYSAKGGWPVISYGHGTTGIADQCAPTRNTPGGPAESYISYTDDILNSWLDAGYAIARSDYEGLGTPGTHPFLVGKSSGRGILDIVRAAHRLNPRISKKFVITGHSQGGHAALFAADQALTWTPDLQLKGTVAYAPASQLKEQLP